MLLSAVSFAKSKSKNILVKMLSQAGTGYSFNTKRSRLREKLTILHYDPVVRAVFLAHSLHLLAVSSHGGRARKLRWGFCYKSINPVHEGSTIMIKASPKSPTFYYYHFCRLVKMRSGELYNEVQAYLRGILGSVQDQCNK